MADISSIAIGSETFDVKDANARERIAKIEEKMGESAAVTDETLLKAGLALTWENGLIGLGSWTASSDDEPVLSPDTDKFCTRKLKTSSLPDVTGELVPWKYNFWKDGVNLGVELTYAEAQDQDVVNALDFDEVALSFGYGWVGDGTDTVTLYIYEKKAYKYNKVLVIGDSISADSYGNYPKWVTVLMEEGFFPADTENNSVPATGFLARYTAEDADAENDFVSRLENEEWEFRSDYDLVILFGGINDYIQSVPIGTADEDYVDYFMPAVDVCIHFLVETFTQARIVVLSPLMTYNTYPNAEGLCQEEYAACIREVAKSYCLPVLNLTEESGFCPFIETFKDMWTLVPDGYDTADGVHPNAEYQKKYLAPMIRRFLENLA